MPNTFIKATKVVSAGLGALARDVVLPNLVWTNAGGDFAGAAGDTISIRIPQYRNAQVRDLRAGTPISGQTGAETKVDVTLEHDVYDFVPITDEEMELDIADFGEQILGPVMAAVVRGIEDELIDVITGADYALTQDFSKTKPLDSVLGARKKLNDCNAPQGSRVLAVGSTIEQYILKDLAGRENGSALTETALTEATIALNYGGFRVVLCNGLSPDEAVAFHRSAFVLSTRAPRVPDGATWGSAQSAGGFSLRVIKDYDPANVTDRCIANCWIGANVVKDAGDLNDDGQFVPSDGNDSGAPILVRAVKLSIPGGS